MADATPLDAYLRRLDVAGTVGWIRLNDWRGGRVARVAASVAANPTWRHSARWAAKTCGMDAWEFRHFWERYAGCLFHEFVDRVRVERALKLLATTDLGIAAIADRASFEDIDDLRWSFRDSLGERYGTASQALRPGNGHSQAA